MSNRTRQPQLSPPLEQLSRVTPLALRFWDLATQRAIAAGLAVTAFLPAAPALRRNAVFNGSGVALLNDLPGLRTVEYGSGDATFWSALPPGRLFTVEIQDGAGHFLPCTLAVTAPQQGFVPWQCPAATVNPPLPPGVIPLFSAPGRPVPAGMAAVRAALWDPIQNRPAAGAVLEVKPDGEPAAWGLAGADGQVLVLLPYPEPIPPGVNGGGPKPLSSQHWPSSVRVFYAPTLPSPTQPDLCQALQQPLGGVWQRRSPAQALGPVELVFGQTTALKTVDGERSTLLITAAGVQPS